MLVETLQYLRKLRRYPQYLWPFLALAPSRFGATRLAIAITRLHLERFVPRRLRRGVALDIERHGRRLRVRLLHKSDLQVVRELYLENAYSADPPQPPDIIFDVGSHVGLAALDFRARWPQATIFAIEPDPRTFGALSWNTMHDPKIISLQVALGVTDGSRDFFISKEPWTSGLWRRRADDVRTEVPARTLDSLCETLRVERIDLLKLDVEGAELEVLSSSRSVSRIPTIIGELHADVLPLSPDRFFEQCLPGRHIALTKTPTGYLFTAVRDPVAGSSRA